MDTAWLEEHLRNNPQSPLFARLAAVYTAAGRNAEAVALCRNGVAVMPGYATGHLVLAKCYAKENHFALALASLEEAHRIAGEFPAYEALRDSWSLALPLAEAPPDEPVPAFAPAAADASVPAPAAVSALPPEEPPAPAVILPPAAEPRPAEAPTAFVVISPTVVSIERPPQAAESAPTPDLSSEELAQIQRPVPVENDEGRIISKTLAEIFATQGEYDEAIVTYRLLLQVRPDITEEIHKRIAELTKLRDDKAAQEAASSQQ